MDYDPTTRVTGAQFLERWDQGGMAKKAADDSVKSFVRMRVREDGIARQIQPPIQVSNSDLSKLVDTDLPAIVIDKEPNSPAAYSVPFGSQPFRKIMRAPRFAVVFDRIEGPAFYQDVNRLRTYDMDIRQVLSDNAVKDMLAEEDGKFLAVCRLIVGAANTTVPETGGIQHVELGGGVSRDTLNEALKILPRLPSALSTARILINQIMLMELQKFGHEEIGGPASEEIFFNGWAKRQFAGKQLIVTIKRRLVGDNEVFVFAEPAYMGKFFILDDVTLFIDRQAFHLSFFPYESTGCAIANAASVGLMTITG